uniref:Uncharacterized protein n=1 Tax=Arundo donax TaxID=35708 RepID=A0A0A9EKT1_ARUDO
MLIFMPSKAALSGFGFSCFSTLSFAAASSAATAAAVASCSHSRFRRVK